MTGKAKDATNQAADHGQYAKDKASKVASDTADSATAAKNKAHKVASDTADSATAAKNKAGQVASDTADSASAATGKASKMASDAYDAVSDTYPSSQSDMLFPLVSSLPESIGEDNGWAVAGGRPNDGTVATHAQRGCTWALTGTGSERAKRCAGGLCQGQGGGYWQGRL